MLKHRWLIAILITAAIAISYFDRQTFPVAIKAINQEIPVSDEVFGKMASVFLAGYGIMYLLGGQLVDRLGTRRAFFIIMVLWSLACASTGLANSVAFFIVCRFLLGLGEGGGFPAVTKAVAEWFPLRQRSAAMGLINAGTAAGSVLAAPGVALIIAISHDWRWAFYVAGIIGLLWTLWWLWEYYPPAMHPRISCAEREEIANVVGQPAKIESRIRWASLLKYKQVWGIVSAKFLSDAAWFFYTPWLIKFFYDIHHFDIKTVGYFAWIPYAASGVGSILGGGYSAWLLRKGYSLNASRKLALGLSVACMPWIFFVTQVSAQWAIVLFSLGFFGQQSWSTLVMTLPTDMFPRRIVGSVAGMVGFGGAMGGLLYNFVAGQILGSLGRETGYVVVFGIASSFHILAYMLILATVPRVEPIAIGGEP